MEAKNFLLGQTKILRNLEKFSTQMSRNKLPPPPRHINQPLLLSTRPFWASQSEYLPVSGQVTPLFKPSSLSVKNTLNAPQQSYSLQVLVITATRAHLNENPALRSASGEPRGLSVHSDVPIRLPEAPPIEAKSKAMQLTELEDHESHWKLEGIVPQVKTLAS